MHLHLQNMQLQAHGLLVVWLAEQQNETEAWALAAAQLHLGLLQLCGALQGHQAPSCWSLLLAESNQTEP